MRFWVLIIFIIIMTLIQNAVGAEITPEEIKKEVKHLNTNQVRNIKDIIKIGDLFKAKDGTKFGLTLAAIMGRESSFGEKLVNAPESNRTLENTSLGGFHWHVESAQYIIEKADLEEYKNMNKYQLAYRLLHDIYFSAELTGYYLVYHYNKALDMNMKNPWRAAISKHNGGWNNIAYVNKVKKDLKVVEIARYMDENEI